MALGLIGWIRGERPSGTAVAGTLVNACGLLLIVGCFALAAVGSQLQQTRRVAKDDRFIEVARPLYKVTIRYPWREVPPAGAQNAGFDMLLAADDRTTLGIRTVASGSKAEDLIKRFLAGRTEKYRSNMQFASRTWLRVECAGTVDGGESIEICYASDSARVMMLGQCRPEERMEKTSMIDSIAATVQLTVEGGGP
ncbi:MAG: hypothetical protein IT577_13835 [Verrucomicrobiae bacterium]|nr:hypothetical protein [Verrucomicrobiae bacterium]